MAFVEHAGIVAPKPSFVASAFTFYCLKRKTLLSEVKKT